MSGRHIEVIESYAAIGDELAKEDSKFHIDCSFNRLFDGLFVCCTLVATGDKLGLDGRIKAYVSRDICKTWAPIVSPTCHDEKDYPINSYRLCHITEIEQGCLISVYLMIHRTSVELPQFHSRTGGMLHSEVRVVKSYDCGKSWTRPRTLDYVLPDLIIPGKCMVLRDGSLAILCEVWHEWDKGWKEGPSSRFIRSFDKGETWPQAAIMARDRDCIHGDPRLSVFEDGKLLALFWKHNLRLGKDMRVHAAQSTDNGATWSKTWDTGIVGQIANPASLGNGIVLCVYQDRFSKDAGLKAILSYDEGETWDSQTRTPIWIVGKHTDNQDPFAGFSEYAFGYSSVLRLSHTQVLVPFWVSNGKTTYVRVLKVEVK